MYYNELAGLNVSALGMGNMRLPTIGGDPKAPIDRAVAEKMIHTAIAGGINYFDTAYRYHGGESETFLGDVLSQYPRESYYLASKYPGHMMVRKGGLNVGFKGLLAGHADSTRNAVFEEQLEKCKTDYFDFYLLHNMSESSYEFFTNEKFGLIPYLQEQKAAGHIRHLGISSHGSPETIDKFLTRYEGVFDVVQIQLNYLDWKLQNAKAKYDVITKHGLKVVVMEGIRGGRLAKLPEAGQAILDAAGITESPASLALRWLQTLPGVAVVLSGMSTPEQLSQNLQTFATHNPLPADQCALLSRVADSMLTLVPCTACRYCTDGCPMGLNIPRLMQLYNEEVNGGGMLTFTRAEDAVGEDPAQCIGCGSCAALCPQSIDIPGIMAKFAEMLAK